MYIQNIVYSSIKKFRFQPRFVPYTCYRLWCRQTEVHHYYRLAAEHMVVLRVVVHLDSNFVEHLGSYLDDKTVLRSLAHVLRRTRSRFPWMSIVTLLPLVGIG